MINHRIYNLLNLNPRKEEERKLFNNDAVMEEFQQSPHNATIKCTFEFIDVGTAIWTCYPLHIAISLGASPELVELLYKAYPEAIEKKCAIDIGCTARSNYGGCSPLHLAAMFGSSPVVIDMLLKWCSCPDAALMEKKGRGDTPLHIACSKSVQNTPSAEVVSLFLEKCPDAALDKNIYGHLPLHMVCHHSKRIPKSVEIVSLLLEAQPLSGREKSIGGNTPLHYACESGAPFEVVSLLLEKCPVAAREKNRRGQTPLHIACSTPRESNDIIKILLEYYPNALKETDAAGDTPQYSSILYAVPPTNEIAIIIAGMNKLVSKDIKNDTAVEILNQFIQIDWWNGIKHVFDHYPTIVQHLTVPTNVLPGVFCVVGRRCRLLTMWDILRNSQDLLSEV